MQRKKTESAYFQLEGATFYRLSEVSRFQNLKVVPLTPMEVSVASYLLQGQVPPLFCATIQTIKNTKINYSGRANFPDLNAIAFILHVPLVRIKTINGHVTRLDVDRLEALSSAYLPMNLISLGFYLITVFVFEAAQ